eukprot:CAMPEP_0180835142 /NCGR_PEP_ID=MMETSP1038_2-20121128/78217_1 /TAXON_ID=632150 /ORGANISM="Azadinium spinosum, Strain 3D9" /LENGTH=258 /DNA_ID=CAMNT_0022878393 /DNA_START=307 /DNA_END=1082 /DNA_ORIENTATION=-
MISSAKLSASEVAAMVPHQAWSLVCDMSSTEPCSQMGGYAATAVRHGRLREGTASQARARRSPGRSRSRPATFRQVMTSCLSGTTSSVLDGFEVGLWDGEQRRRGGTQASLCQVYERGAFGVLPCRPNATLWARACGLFTTNVPGELAEAHGVGPSIVLEEQCLAAERAAAPCGVDGAGDAASAPGSGASVCEALLKARAPPNWKEASVGAAVVEASAVVVKVVVLAVVVEIFDVLGLASTGAMAGFAQSLTFAQSLA